MKIVIEAVLGPHARALSRLRLFSIAGAAPPRLLIDAFSLRVSAAAMAMVMTLSPALTFAQSVPAGTTTPSIEAIGDGPAVNLDEPSERKTPSSKRNRANARRAEIGRSNDVRLAGGAQ